MRSESGVVEVYTFKQGLLSKVAHDLKFNLGRFSVELADGRVEATFFPDSLSVSAVVRDGGRLDSDAPSPKDRAEIANNIRTKILHTDRYPEICFRGRFADSRVEGELSMAGRTQSIEFDAEVRDGLARGEVTIEPSRWGIAPFKALLGAIKLEDRVKIRFELRYESDA